MYEHYKFIKFYFSLNEKIIKVIYHIEGFKSLTNQIESIFEVKLVGFIEKKEIWTWWNKKIESYGGEIIENYAQKGLNSIKELFKEKNRTLINQIKAVNIYEKYLISKSFIKF